MAVRVPVKRLDPGLPMPTYAHEGDAGLDLYSAVDATLKPGERSVIPTGISIAIPEGYAGFVQPRSGLALTKGLSIVNSPGLIDSGYRGEILVIAVNLDNSEAVEIRRGDRIAQMVVVPVAHAELVEVEQLPPSERGERGHGSSG